MKNNYEYHALSTPVTLQAHNGSLLTQTKDILGPYLDKDLKNIVDHNYVSDKFISIDKSKHNILFAGCSVTVGCGLDTVKKTWAYKLYEYKQEAFYLFENRKKILRHLVIYDLLRSSIL